MSLQSICSGFTVNIQKKAPAVALTGKDADGGAKQNPWTTVAGPYPCDIQPASADVRRRYGNLGPGQMQLTVSHEVFFQTDIGLKVNHRLQTIDGTRTFLVHGYAVEPAAGRPGFWQPVFTAICEEQLQPA